MSKMKFSSYHDADIEASEVQLALQDLVNMGYVEHTGEFRNGRPVYRLTDLGLARSAREEGKLS